MCLISTISKLGAVLVCAAVGWVVLGAGGGILRFVARVFVTLLAIACIGAGVAVFSSRPHYEHTPRAVDSRASASHPIELDEIQIDVPVREIHVAPKVRFERNFPFQHGFPFEEHRQDSDAMPKWLLIALGTVLVIGGSLLFNRERTRPVALRAFTLLGLAATGFILYSLFSTPTRHVTQSSDRVIKVSSTADEPPAEADQPRKAKRPSRAARPIARAKRPVERDPAIDQLPPRSGEIPVAAELAKTEPAAPVQPVAAELAVPPAEPAIPPEAPEPQAPAAAPDAHSPSEPASPATPAPTASAPQAAEVKPLETDPPTANPAETKPAKAAAAVAVPDASAPPSAAPDAAETRPAWVEMPGKLDGSVYRSSVASGVYVDAPECQRALEAQIKHSADQYIEDYLGPGTAAMVDIPRSYLLEHIKHDEFHEIVQASVGPMHQIHALLEFDDGARAVFHERWRRTIVTDRLWYVGSAGAVVLALLATFYGYLKLDLRTGGSHSGRLQLAATLVALIVAAGALLARWALPF